MTMKSSSHKRGSIYKRKVFITISGLASSIDLHILGNKGKREKSLDIFSLSNHTLCVSPVFMSHFVQQITGRLNSSEDLV